jgi:tripartite-type tricarboxylate transporter receptor subunit TctC
MHRLRRRHWLLCLPGLGCPTARAQTGQDFPHRPIRVVVPSPPGGPPDLILRAIMPKLAATLSQPVVAENRAGGGGLVGTAHVARQPADG